MFTILKIIDGNMNYRLVFYCLNFYLFIWKIVSNIRIVDNKIIGPRSTDIDVLEMIITMLESALTASNILNNAWVSQGTCWIKKKSQKIFLRLYKINVLHFG